MSHSPARWLATLAGRIRALCARIGRRERLRVYLGQGWLAVCVIEGRLRTRMHMRATAVLSCSLPDTGANQHLDAQLATLHAWLRTHPVRGKMEWITGLQHVRYLVLPWDERLSDSAFCRSLASALFAQQFADAAGERDFAAYDMRLGPLSYGRSRVAALIARDVLTQLTAFAPAHGCRTGFIAPMLTVVWNHLGASARAGRGLLALVEGQRVLLAGHERGHITSIQLRPYSGNPDEIAATGATHQFPTPGMTSSVTDMPTPAGLAPCVDARLAYASCGVV
ncbi:hypothetical protein [Burkholderia sp. Ac-20365]|uniref:hypothetical protein n=1 Tax=Burkholderia sp. Ac-20365 TaxID=2703897 RepID=UPI00197B4912|nr:hypothetical protein [Burkholderia sp. Ac-20365]MBN3759424.1 hypothetical protein [Burkholderia sp. Ac-20365]